MKYTNLNIKNANNTFKYVIGYLSSRGDESVTGKTDKFVYADLQTISQSNTYTFKSSSDSAATTYVRTLNEWSSSTSKAELVWTGTCIPETSNCSVVRVYFPEFSVDTYENRVKYMLDVSVWIHGRTISLGSFLLDRSDAVACPRVTRILDENYYECIDVIVPDPMDILYSDDWDGFRKGVCGKSDTGSQGEDVSTRETNDDIPCLFLGLNVVTGTGQVDEYMKMDGYTGCQGSLLMSDINDYLSLTLAETITSSSSSSTIVCSPVMNRAYHATTSESDLGNIYEYIRETYGVEPTSLRLEVVVADEDNIYKSIYRDLDETGSMKEESWKFDIYNDFPDFLFKDWTEWSWGMSIMSTLTVYYIGNDDSETKSMFIKSNSVPITPDLFRFLTYDSSYTGSLKNLHYINLDDIDMTSPIVNVVNKNVQNIIQLENNVDGKSKFIKSVFFRTHDLANIVVHPDVTETICLNLDSYKSKVSTFSIQIENTIFTELGRNNSGVLFKIVGSKLPGSLTSGTYYILDGNNEMITNGKYIYEY